MPALAGALRRTSGGAAGSVRDMLASAPHRGTAHRVVEVGPLALGVADVEDGRQSDVCLEDGRAAAIVGRLDNQADLISELARRGRPPRSTTMASVVLAAFDAFGDEAPSHLRGEFALAVGDGSGIRCARDQLGFRALFHRHDRHGATVASEAKQVLAGTGTPVEPDLDVVEQIFFGGLHDETATALRGVLRLPKATTLTATADGRSSTRYWRPEDLLETGRWAPSEIQERFDALMSQAASRMMTPATAVSLSGGIDSPAVAAYAAPHHLALTGRRLRAVSRLYPDQPSVDEREYIELVAEALDLDLVTYVHRTDHLQDVATWTRRFDGPVPHWSGSDLTANLLQAARVGATTVLTGELAEFVVDAGEHLDAHLLAHGRWSALADRARARRACGQPWSIVGRRALTPFVPRPVAKAMARLRVTGRSRPIPAWLDPNRLEVVPRHLELRAGERWRWNQLRAFDGAGLSVEAEEIRQDVIGVRVRMPWADVDLWEFFLSMRAEVKYPGIPHKAQVRELLRGRVPDPILDRTDKTIFNDALRSAIDYDALRSWLVDPDVELRGVDYRRLRGELEREGLDVYGYIWARDLCVAHAFLRGWSDADAALRPLEVAGP